MNQIRPWKTRLIKKLVRPLLKSILGLFSISGPKISVTCLMSQDIWLTLIRNGNKLEKPCRTWTMSDLQHSLRGTVRTHSHNMWNFLARRLNASSCSLCSMTWAHKWHFRRLRLNIAARWERLLLKPVSILMRRMKGSRRWVAILRRKETWLSDKNSQSYD